jgi:hypothetical protein
LLTARQGGPRFRAALRWKASAELRAVRTQHGADLAVFNSETNGTLTMPTRYIVASHGMVEHADISGDYTRRGDPSEQFPFSTTLRPRSSR